jgi:outer membrane biosynthesis protein TonB
MTQASRSVALAHAVTIAGAGSETDLVLGVAEQFHAFILADEQQAAAPAAPAAPAATAPAPKPEKAPKPAKAPKPEPKPRMVPEDETPDEEPADEVVADADAVKGIISKLLATKLRDECVALLKLHKATSFSGIKEADYPAFVKAGNEILANAALGS